MSRSVTLGVFLLAGIGLWFARKPWHPAYVQAKAVALSELAQGFAGTNLVESPIAHDLLPDFAQLDHYRSNNRNLPFASHDLVIFYGDSITDFWPTSFGNQFFHGKPYIGRGIRGQSTPRLLWRFQQDVLDLHPAAVILLGGTNDVIMPHSLLTTQQTLGNLETMVSMAQRHGIRVIVCSILPVSHFPARKQAAFTARIEVTNSALHTFADQQKVQFVNYFYVMADASGSMNPAFSPDGVHPNAAGYAVMHALVQQAIDQAPRKR